MRNPTTICGVDVETSSACDIKAGAWAYAMHESTVCLCAVFVLSQGPKDPNTRRIRWMKGDPVPEPVRVFVESGGMMLAHNRSFEIAIWANVLTPDHGFPPVPASSWQDSALLGQACNLPKSLDGLAKVLKCDVQKDGDGYRLMMSMCKAKPVEGHPGEYSYPNQTLDNLRRLADYCEKDVLTMLGCFWKLPALSRFEARVAQIDAEINARGVCVDLSFIDDCRYVGGSRAQELKDSTFAVTSSYCDGARNSNTLLAWLERNGVKAPKRQRSRVSPSGKALVVWTPSVDAAAVAELLERSNLPDDVRRVLHDRVEENKVVSLSKLAKIPTMVDAQGRLRNALAYCAAGTGRWSSYGVQIHNLARDKMPAETSAAVRKTILARDLDALTTLVPRPLEAISQSIRSVFVAGPGRELIAADWSAIEARVIAWLAGATKLVGMFRKGTDVYVHDATSAGSDPTHAIAIGVDPKVARKAHRDLGKVLRLGLGYGMGSLKLSETGAKQGIDALPKVWKARHAAWRDDNPEIVAFWDDLNTAAIAAIRSPDVRFSAGLVSFSYSSRAKCLHLKLPSGRVVRYWGAKVAKVRKVFRFFDSDGNIVEKARNTVEIQYYTAKGGKMARTETYGGKLAENVTQAVARDLLAFAMVTVTEEGGYDIVIHVHDSLGAEVLTGTKSVEDFCDLICKLPPWAKGLPLAAEGYRSHHFQG